MLSHLQTFAARGVHSSCPIASVCLPATLAAVSSPLPADTQLSLLLAQASHLQPEQLVEEGRATIHSNAGSAGSSANEQSVDEAVYAAGNIGLMQSHALSHSGQSTGVQQLLPSPVDPGCVAFSLACGACGVPIQLVNVADVSAPGICLS